MNDLPKTGDEPPSPFFDNIEATENIKTLGLIQERALGNRARRAARWAVDHIATLTARVAEVTTNLEESCRQHHEIRDELKARVAEVEGNFDKLRRSRNIMWCSQGHEILLSSPLPDYPILLGAKCGECGEWVRTREALAQNEDKLKAEIAQLRGTP